MFCKSLPDTALPTLIIIMKYIRVLKSSGGICKMQTYEEDQCADEGKHESHFAFRKPMIITDLKLMIDELGMQVTSGATMTHGNAK